MEDPLYILHRTYLDDLAKLAAPQQRRPAKAKGAGGPGARPHGTAWFAILLCAVVVLPWIG